eukprot:m.4475 g.4475  ORF g.4475 m.4475 type:complete len:65 (+) comp4322_c0_seq1:121-315(+)
MGWVWSCVYLIYSCDVCALFVQRVVIRKMLTISVSILLSMLSLFLIFLKFVSDCMLFICVCLLN